jgi:phosphatidylinositol-3-phosphatase
MGVTLLLAPGGRSAEAATLTTPATGSGTSRSATDSPAPDAQRGSAQLAAGSAVTKLLVFVEENHSLDEMKTGMPYTFSLAQKYGYATAYDAIRHPSLPNYLAIAGGSTYGVTDDKGPSAHPISGASVFGQALALGRTAKVYADGMTTACQRSNSGTYAVRHNPWAYYTDAAEKRGCASFDVPVAALATDVTNGNLPNIGMVIPDLCHDAHNCSLGTADTWFKGRMQKILAGPDWASGHLAVVLTADEADSSSAANRVLTVVVHPSQSGRVVSTALTHYSLTRLIEDVAGAPHLNNAATTPDMRSAFQLP